MQHDPKEAIGMDAFADAFCHRQLGHNIIADRRSLSTILLPLVSDLHLSDSAQRSGLADLPGSPHA